MTPLAASVAAQTPSAAQKSSSRSSDLRLRGAA
jgi:hypothetical protein